MTIQIQRPALEALILDRMRKGGFHSVEDALMDALESRPSSSLDRIADETQPAPTGEALVAAMQASPYKEIDLEVERTPLTGREIEL